MAAADRDRCERPRPACAGPGGRLYPYEQRGRPLGWLFGAMAGGMAFGSPLGAMIVPFVGGKAYSSSWVRPVRCCSWSFCPIER